ncbi:MAG: thioredoxin family protein [Akkermansia sp.]
MLIEESLKSQLRPILDELESDYELDIQIHPMHPQRADFVELMEEFAALSPKISLRTREGDDLLFRIQKDGRDLGITFKSIPGEYEFSSLLMLLLNADGKGKNQPDAATLARIKALPTPLQLRTFMLITCPNCPDVVQALNMLTIAHGSATHEIMDTQTHEFEANRADVQAVPAVFINGSLLHVGRTGLEVLLDKLELFLTTPNNTH